MTYFTKQVNFNGDLAKRRSAFLQKLAPHYPYHWNENILYKDITWYLRLFLIEIFCWGTYFKKYLQDFRLAAVANSFPVSTIRLRFGLFLATQSPFWPPWQTTPKFYFIQTSELHFKLPYVGVTRMPANTLNFDITHGALTHHANYTLNV